MLGQVYDRFMVLVAWPCKMRCQAGEGCNQELTGFRMAKGWLRSGKVEICARLAAEEELCQCSPLLLPLP